MHTSLTLARGPIADEFVFALRVAETYEASDPDATVGFDVFIDDAPITPERLRKSARVLMQIPAMPIAHLVVGHALAPVPAGAMVTRHFAVIQHSTAPVAAGRVDVLIGTHEHVLDALAGPRGLPC